MTAFFIICLFLAVAAFGALVLLALVLHAYDPDPCNQCNYNCNHGHACPFRK